MNFSFIEESISKEKNKFSNFSSYFFKNARILIILLVLAIITTISISIWKNSSDYQILYNNLSDQDGKVIIDYLNQMKIPYQFSNDSGKLLVPKDKIYDIRLYLSEKKLPSNSVGFEILDKEKFGISQFNEQINYQRALEGELARTIQRINIIRSARIHIAIPKSSLFLQDQKKPSASVILSLKPGAELNTNQINGILYLISNSISDLSINNITIVDEFGKFLNNSEILSDQINNAKLKYSEQVELRYANKIQNILEPLFGAGNVHAQVTAQIDFNSQEKTHDQYEPNANYKNQSIRSHQTIINDQVKYHQDDNNSDIFSNYSLSNQNNNKLKKSNNIKSNKLFQDNSKNTNSFINHDDTINYELNHTLSHIKMNMGEVKRLSAAVIINFVKDKTGAKLPLTTTQIQNIKNLVSESIGYSKIRGDSVHIINASFSKNTISPIPKVNNLNQSDFLNNFSNLTPWCISGIFFLYLLKKCICFLSNTIFKNQILNKKNKNEKIIDTNNKKIVNDIQQNTVVKNPNINNIDNLIHKICNISNQNPRVIASIIRQWMSNKK